MRLQCLSNSLRIATVTAAWLAANGTAELRTVSQERPTAPARSTIIERIRSNDEDGDGTITKSEASEQLKRRFDQIDANGDGVLDEQELQRLAERMRRGQRTAQRPNTARPAQRAEAVPPGVELITDIAYREGSEACRLDLAIPKDRGDSLRPGLVIVHGGGWRSGDKGGGLWRSLPLQYAAKGYVCISVNYRLTGEATFPACVEDVKCAVRWLRAHANKYNVDPQRIGGYGNSAGAHLVALLGLVSADAGLEGDGPYQDHSSLLQAVCCSATPTDFLNWARHEDRPGAGAGGGLLAGPAETWTERAKKASPISYVHADAPPFLVIHGTADRTVPVSQGDRFVEALKKAGAKDVTYLRFDGSGHGVFNEHADKTGPAMEEFFARTLRAASRSEAIE